MKDKKYLLSLADVKKRYGEGNSTENLPADMWEKITAVLDKERLKKLKHIKRVHKQLESVGAGMLLQLAMQEALEDGEDLQDSVGIVEWTFMELLDKLVVADKPLPLEYTYGPQGKPYFKEYPYYFSLSHSGDYVFCVLSTREVGADIQQQAMEGKERLVQRFFATEEIKGWEQCDTEAEKSDYFYKLWCRKEAYGKLTGEGIADAVSLNMCDGQTEKVPWLLEEYKVPGGYRIALCKWK